VFDGEDALDKLEAFTSKNGAAFYGLPTNDSKVKLTRSTWTMPVTSIPPHPLPSLAHAQHMDHAGNDNLNTPPPPPTNQRFSSPIPLNILPLSRTSITHHFPCPLVGVVCSARRWQHCPPPRW
jgi:hypothetical protein